MLLNNMAGSLRIEYDGAVYHITSQGNTREPLYKEKNVKMYTAHVKYGYKFKEISKSSDEVKQLRRLRRKSDISKPDPFLPL